MAEYEDWHGSIVEGIGIFISLQKLTRCSNPPDALGLSRSGLQC
jgi:hypothetical protein